LLKDSLALFTVLHKEGVVLGVEKLARNPQSKDEALEALDFIVNVLKEHEKDLDKLINELATVTEQIGDTGQINDKVEKVEEKINGLQKEVTSLITYLSSAPKEALPTTTKEQAAQTVPATLVQGGPNVILRCKRWEDFQILAFQAQTLSFSYKEDEKVFQADALKGNQIITFSGVIPNFSDVLKAWLSKKLDVPENSVLEGLLAIG
jgi:seryl-tRNA synthetase